MPRPTLRRLPAFLAVLATTASVVGGLAAVPQAAQSQACAGRTVDGGVTVVRPPAFPVAPTGLVGAGTRGALVDLALERTEGKRAWVTDGWSIARTDNAGCDWKIVFSLDDLGGVEAQSSAIVALAVPDAATDALLYVLVRDLSVPNTAARFRVLVSNDSGASFFEGGAGLDAVNLGAGSGPCGDDSSCDILGTTDPATVYLRFAGADRTVIYRSKDGGQTFEARNAATAFASTNPANGLPEAPPVLRDLAVDPLDLNRLWGVSNTTGPHHTADGGSTFTHYEPFEHFTLPLTNIRHVDMAALDVPGAESMGLALVSGDDVVGAEHLALGVEGFGFVPIGGTVRGSVTGLVLTDSITAVVATERGLVAGYSQGPDTPLADTRHGNLRSLQAVHAFGSSVGANGQLLEPVWGINDTEIVVALVEARNGDPVASIGIDRGNVVGGLFDPLVFADISVGELRGLQEINLAVGQSAELPYILDVPAVPTKVDVFFLLDQTGSMQDEFDALALGMDRIAQDLEASGIDVNVGLGTYGNGFRYKLHRAIGPVDEEFTTKLQGIKAGGDGEVAYTALQELILGRGLKRSKAGNGVPSGNNAKWRPSARRMIVHSTDEELSEEPEGPYIPEVMETLRGSGVQHLGLIAYSEPAAVTPDQDNPTQSQVHVVDWEPMFDLARETGAFAPDGEGIDCDGDGIVDVQPGDPIACYLSPLTTNKQISDLDRADLIPDLSTVILAMLEADTLRGTVQFNKSSSRLVTGFVAGARNVADFRRPVVMPARARAVCTEATEGVEEGVTLTATSGTIVLGGLRLRVTCGLTDADPLPANLLVPVGIVAAGAPASPPAPIQAPSVSQGAAQSGVQSVASSNSFVPQAGAAAAQQEQQQYQTAAIGKSGQQDEQPGIAYEFSARRDQDSSGLTLAAAGVMAVGAGLVGARQRRREVARIGVRRGR